MQIVIVEDEMLAAERLADLIGQYAGHFQILAILDSVEGAIAWFRKNKTPDLAFFDIQLADGLSFEIFEKIIIPCPVIFTTAYDDYALRAFKVNSIDYLLKPIDLDELSKAIQQYEQLKTSFSQSTPLIQPETVKAAIEMLQRKHKSRFMVKAGQRLHSVPVEEVLYFYHEHKLVWLKKTDLKKHSIDYTLDQLEHLLNPEYFFRLNRKFIVSFLAINEVLTYTNSRLRVLLKDFPKEEKILISREKVAAFKNWMDQ